MAAFLPSLLAASLMLGPTGDLPAPVERYTPAQMLYLEDGPVFADEYAPPPRRMRANNRAACAGAVNQAMAMTGGELLSVKANRNQGVCVVTMLVIKQNGRPKKVRLRIPMDY
jgi:hypothetical protein